MSLARVMDELEFHVEADVREYCVDFRIYDIVGRTYPDNALAYMRAGATSSMDVTYVLAEAQLFAHGTVKWDGCSDWHIDEQDGCMLHGCTREDLTRIGEVLARCRDWTTEILPTWDGNLAD